MNRIREYVESLFSSAPQTKKILEMKEELIVNLEEKYSDLIKIGKTEHEAFNIIAEGIGDINELIEGVSTENHFIKDDELKRRKNLRALVITLSVALYFLSFTVWYAPEYLSVSRQYNMPAGFILAGIATCLLVFINLSTPGYKKTDNTIIEEFKEWKSDNEKKRKIKSSLISAMWCITTALYFLASFSFGHWHISWLIFPFAAVVQQVISILFHLSEWGNGGRKKIKGNVIAALWCMTSIIYFLMSFTFGNWHISWLIFPFAAVVQQGVLILFNLFEWRSGGKSKIKGNATAALWCTTTIVYFLMSFTFGNWHISWIIFLFTVVIQQIFNIFFNIIS